MFVPGKAVEQVISIFIIAIFLAKYVVTVQRDFWPPLVS